MLQIILGITRYNSVLLGFKTDKNEVVLSCTELSIVILSYTELYRDVPKMILENKNGPISYLLIYLILNNKYFMFQV